MFRRVHNNYHMSGMLQGLWDGLQAVIWGRNHLDRLYTNAFQRSQRRLAHHSTSALGLNQSSSLHSCSTETTTVSQSLVHISENIRGNQIRSKPGDVQGRNEWPSVLYNMHAHGLGIYGTVPALPI